MSWSALSAVWIKGASFLAQVILGYLLSEEEWGIYAIAIAFSGLATAFRDGGALEILVQRGRSEYSTLWRPVFSLALAVNVLLGLSLAVVAPLVAAFYGIDQVADLLWVVAIGLVLSTPATLLKTKLRIELRFEVIAKLAAAAALVQYGASVGLAWLGFGPLSFVLPIPIVALFECLALLRISGGSPWPGRLDFRGWRDLVGQVRWLAAGALATLICTMGDYVVLGRLVPPAVVGVYYFAFQLSVQGTRLAASNLGTVLMPTLVAMSDDAPRQGRAVVRAFRSLVLLVAPVSLALALVIEPLETLMWRGRWSSAVVPVQLLCVMLPIRVPFAIGASLLKARGAFRRWALSAAAFGIGLLVIAAIAGSMSSGASSIAACIAIYFIIATPLVLQVAIRTVGVTFRQLAAALFPPWLTALACGAACLVADAQFLQSLPPIFRLGATLGLFLLLFAGSARLLLREALVDTLSVLPAPLASFGTLVLALPRSAERLRNDATSTDC